jgi:hypothetical protein
MPRRRGEEQEGRGDNRLHTALRSTQVAMPMRSPGSSVCKRAGVWAWAVSGMRSSRRSVCVRRYRCERGAPSALVWCPLRVGVESSPGLELAGGAHAEALCTGVRGRAGGAFEGRRRGRWGEERGVCGETDTVRACGA